LCFHTDQQSVALLFPGIEPSKNIKQWNRKSAK